MQRKDSSSNEGDLKKKTSDIDYVMDDDQRLPVAGDGCASSLPGTAHSSKTNSCSSSITSLPSPASIRARRASGTSNSILATQSYEEEKAVDSLEDRFPFLKDDRKRTRKLLSPEQTRILEAILERTVYPSTPLREAVARQLGVSPRKVQIWFQNKRQGRRRQVSINEEINNGVIERKGQERRKSGSDNRAEQADDDSRERCLKIQSAADDLRLAELRDEQGRQFAELKLGEPYRIGDMHPAPQVDPLDLYCDANEAQAPKAPVGLVFGLGDTMQQSNALGMYINQQVRHMPCNPDRRPTLPPLVEPNIRFFGNRVERAGIYENDRGSSLAHTRDYAAGRSRYHPYEPRPNSTYVQHSPSASPESAHSTDRQPIDIHRGMANDRDGRTYTFSSRHARSYTESSMHVNGDTMQKRASISCVSPSTTSTDPFGNEQSRSTDSVQARLDSKGSATADAFLTSVTHCLASYRSESAAFDPRYNPPPASRGKNMCTIDRQKWSIRSTEHNEFCSMPPHTHTPLPLQDGYRARSARHFARVEFHDDDGRLDPPCGSVDERSNYIMTSSADLSAHRPPLMSLPRSRSATEIDRQGDRLAASRLERTPKRSISADTSQDTDKVLAPVGSGTAGATDRRTPSPLQNVANGVSQKRSSTRTSPSSPIRRRKALPSIAELVWD